MQNILGLDQNIFKGSSTPWVKGQSDNVHNKYKGQLGEQRFREHAGDRQAELHLAYDT